tara:strand:+ start:264 stop:1271 length:1008 start_codon:yes stop_codon:yes gene_type:complete
MVDIFEINADDLEKDVKKKYTNNEFKPNPKEAKDNIYRALIRPVYWMENPKKSFIPKTTFYFGKEDGNDTGNNFFDSAWSDDQSECPAMRTFFDLKREGKTDARADQLAGDIRPKSSFFYLVLVESDAAVPENEGKLMVYKAPIQVHNIIQGAINVSDEDKKIGIKSCNIFDPFKGKSLRLSINMVGTNWNYNGTVSFADAGPIKFEGEDLTVAKKDAFVELLNTGNELLEPYKYKKMDNSRMKLLLSIISDKTGKQFGDVAPAIVTADINIEGLDEPKVEAKAKPKAKPKAKKEETPDLLDEITQESSVVDSPMNNARPADDDVFDDILEGLDV